MHEHGIADDIFQALLREAEKAGATRITAATIVAGEMSGITGDALIAGLEHCCEHANMPPFPVQFEIEMTSAKCKKCGVQFAIDDEAVCTECGCADIEIIPATGVTVRHVEFG